MKHPDDLNIADAPAGMDNGQAFAWIEGYTVAWELCNPVFKCIREGHETRTPGKHMRDPICPDCGSLMNPK